jgi:tetratricopeptide (TPR) repeat protein
MKPSLKGFVSLALLSIVSLPVYSQSPRGSSGLRESDKSKRASVQNAGLRMAKDEDGKNETRDGAYWFNRGYALHQADHYIEAIEAFSHSIGLGYRQATAMYNVACGYALLNDKDNALFWLNRSLAAGFDRADLLKDDPDIASLRGEPRFKHIQELSRVLSLSQLTSGGIDGSQYSKQRWAPAVKKYESFLRDHPDNGRGWFDLGYALHYSSEHTRAIQAFEQAIQFGYRKPTSLYNIACAHAMMGNRDTAFEWLEKSVDAGFDIGGYINGDEDLDSLRSDPRFKRFSRMAEDQHNDKHKSDK